MIRFLALISAILIIALPAVAEETDKSPTVTNINVEEKEGITEIQIEANSPFEYAVYTPLNPYRIAVELKDINLGRFTKKIVVGKAGVMEIAPADTGDSRDFVRLDIILAEPGEVKSFREGNVLILSVSKMEVKKQEHRAQSTEHREVEVRKQEVLTEVKKDLEVKEQEKPAIAEDVANSYVPKASSEVKEEEKPAAEAPETLKMHAITDI
ncbi:MAG: AMIN domain-containing protein, partial [Nitrospirae bacterium]|nr:AMIN domain-containing protein [Nitrospirota bacterium]